jgi:hypothetical protein
LPMTRLVLDGPRRRGCARSHRWRCIGAPVACVSPTLVAIFSNEDLAPWSACVRDFIVAGCPLIASNEKCVFVSRAAGFMDSLGFGDQAIATRDRNIRRIDHRLRHFDVSFETQRFRHRAITIHQVAVGSVVTFGVSQQRPQPQ